MAKWLDASASFRRPVSGDFATTANFALVVSGVPTSGEKTNASGASGASGSTPGGASRCMSQAPRPAPPMQSRAGRAPAARAARLRRCRRRRRAPGRSSRRAPAATRRHRAVIRLARRGVIARAPRRLSSRSAARRRAPSWKRGSGPSTSRAGWMPRIEEASSSSSAAARRSSVRRSSRAGWSASTRARTVPGQLAAVERRRHEVSALDYEDVRVRRLEHVAVEVHDQRHRVEPLGQLVEQPPVAPLVSTEPAGQHRGSEHHRCPAPALRRATSRLDVDRASAPAETAHAAAAGAARGRCR